MHKLTYQASCFKPLYRLRNDLYCVGWGVKLYSNQTKSSHYSLANDAFCSYFIPTLRGDRLMETARFTHSINSMKMTAVLLCDHVIYSRPMYAIYSIIIINTPKSYVCHERSDNCQILHNRCNQHRSCYIQHK